MFKTKEVIAISPHNYITIVMYTYVEYVYYIHMWSILSIIGAFILKYNTLVVSHFCWCVNLVNLRPKFHSTNYNSNVILTAEHKQHVKVGGAVTYRTKNSA